MRVLIVDDDAETLEFIGRALEKDGHRVVVAENVTRARRALATSAFDIVVLDVMLDGASGLELCARLRKEGIATPILLVSARGTVRARLDGFDAGGDDYLAKPFALRELVARVRALGRRGPTRLPTRVQVGDVEIDFDARRATVAGDELPVTAREWEVLRVLAEEQGRVVEFEELLMRVWGDASNGARASLEVIVSRLRRKLERATGVGVIRTVRGLGYALEPFP